MRQSVSRAVENLIKKNSRNESLEALRVNFSCENISTTKRTLNLHYDEELFRFKYYFFRKTKKDFN